MMAETPRAGRPGTPEGVDADRSARDEVRNPGGTGTDAGRDGTVSPGGRAMQARSDHDHGRYGDKIPVADPAASPLGTDSEAAGLGAPEGSMEPAAPLGGPGLRNGHPRGHARGDMPTAATPWVWSVGAFVVIGALAVAVAALVF